MTKLRLVRWILALTVLGFIAFFGLFLFGLILAALTLGSIVAAIVFTGLWLRRFLTEEHPEWAESGSGPDNEETKV